MIKKFTQYIKEGTENTNSSKYSDIKEEIKGMVEKTIEKSGGEYKSFVDSFLKNPTDVKIEGFINESDIYDFYLKWRNDIDEILNEVKFFDERPSDDNVFGLYDYLIKGTERALLEFLK